MIGLQPIVVRIDLNKGPARGIHTGHDRTQDAAVLREVDDPRERKARHDVVNCFTAVVDDHGFQARIGLPRQTLEHPPQVAAPFVGRRNDRNQR